uniref:Uncharacterized protein n=1 Tax=Plectus sambesii TaxID=2011161 RepID=A0A914W6B0_9BILA
MTEVGAALEAAPIPLPFLVGFGYWAAGRLLGAVAAMGKCVHLFFFVALVFLLRSYVEAKTYSPGSWPALGADYYPPRNPYSWQYMWNKRSPRNPYSWILSAKRASRNPYSWMNAEKRASRNPYSWMSAEKRAPRNSYSWMSTTDWKNNDVMPLIPEEIVEEMDNEEKRTPRNPYSWMVRNSKRATRNPYSWLTTTDNDEQQRPKPPSDKPICQDDASSDCRKSCKRYYVHLRKPKLIFQDQYRAGECLFDSR